MCTIGKTKYKIFMTVNPIMMELWKAFDVK